MKKISLLLLSLLLLQHTWGQNGLPLDEKTGKYTYIDKVSAEGMTATELFDQTNKWAEARGYSASETQAGIKLKFDSKIGVTYVGANGRDQEEGSIAFVFTVNFKDGRYRIIATDFVHTGKKKGTNGGKLENKAPDCGSKVMTQKTWASVKSATNTKMKAEITDLKKVIKEYQNDPERNDDW